jgi:hypothetical protein
VTKTHPIVTLTALRSFAIPQSVLTITQPVTFTSPSPCLTSVSYSPQRLRRLTAGSGETDGENCHGAECQVCLETSFTCFSNSLLSFSAVSLGARTYCPSCRVGAIIQRPEYLDLKCPTTSFQAFVLADAMLFLPLDPARIVAWMASPCDTGASASSF